mgnify:CR=1 FL=1
MPDMSDEADIQWGSLKKDSKDTSRNFYTSFFSEGVEYKLYDNVEVYNHSGEPYIGKIVKLWEEKSTGEKKVLIRWFFKNKELKQNPDGNPKEVFLAFGKGKGVTNENELVMGTKIIRVCLLFHQFNLNFMHMPIVILHSIHM